MRRYPLSHNSFTDLTDYFFKTIISKALKEYSKVKLKFDKAKGYVLHRFVGLRSEERRRVSAD